MKTKLVAILLIAFVCWLVPVLTLAQEIGTPKQKVESILVVAVHKDSYKSEDIIIKDNAIQPIRQEEPSRRNNNPLVHPNQAGRNSDNLFTGRHYSKEEVQQLIRDYSAEYGISADLPLRIARCESGFNQFSKNKTSTASGVFQYLSSTWLGTDQYKAGLSVFDADANVKAAVSYIASRGHARPWTASIHCWSK